MASRTSPTNMGLALLANLAAWDFGYLSVRPTDRSARKMTLATMQRLERHRGHFYNWYETRTLKPLLPLYVSSVDSGNLAGHLLTLGSGLRELADAEDLSRRRFLPACATRWEFCGDWPAENAALAQLDAELAQAAFHSARGV